MFRALQNETLIAIKAPHGTTLEVPDPDEVGLVKVMDLCTCMNDFVNLLMTSSVYLLPAGW
jgi:hypothetical protein